MKLALAGATMLGRGLASRVSAGASVFAPEVSAAAGEADILNINLECCISSRGSPWPDPCTSRSSSAHPPRRRGLASLGVDWVTLANNHALDFGREALLDPFEHLLSVGVAWVGAGVDLVHACRPAVLDAAGLRVGTSPGSS